MSKPPPPPYLSKETLIIWEGWSKMGDREVARESAAKGSHVDLAVTFLSQRKCSNVEKTTEWFNNEITNWASELLLNKQVFRASHILKNIKLDPISEIRNIFQESNNEELREFLGNHLDKINELDDSLKQAWTLIKFIEQDEQILINLEESNIVNIKFISDKDHEWKCKIAAELYLKTYDYSLQSLLTNKHLWNAALHIKALEFLQKWIHVQFSDEEDWLEIDTEVNELLTNFEITSEMIEDLWNNNNVNEPLKTFIYNALAYYGIFTLVERQDICLIIRRLISIANLQSFDLILQKLHANFNLKDFYEMLYEFGFQHHLFIALNSSIDNLVIKHNNFGLNLMSSCKYLVNDFNNADVLKNHLDMVIKNCECNDITKALTILLILQLSKNNLFKVLSENNAMDCDLIWKTLPTFSVIFNKIIKNPKENHLTMYDLLENHSLINIKKLYKYRFDKSHELPHFKLDKLVDFYGIKKFVDYTFFVQQCRPSKACSLVSDGFEAKIYKLAYNNFFKPDISASCIAFLELKGINAGILRIEIAAANIILKDDILCEENIVELLLSNDKEGFLNLYENIICDKYKFDTNIKVKDILILIKEWKFIITLAKHYKLKFPDRLLKMFAEYDLWLPFFITTQTYTFAHDQLMKLVQHFKSDSIFEHLNHCLQYDILYEDKSTLMRDRDSRKYFLSRIGVRKNLDVDSIMTSSMTSQSSLSSTTSSGGLSDVFDADCLDSRTDLLQILIKCHNSNDPPKALLQACYYYKFPLFAVLATSYEPDSFITCWLTWLSVSCNIEDASNYEGIALNGSNVTDYLTSILLKGYYKTLQESFSIFLTDNPLKIFMQFLCDLIELKFNFEDLTKCLEHFHKLVKFKRSNSFVSDIDFDMIYLNNKMWIENTSLNLLAASFQSNFEATYMKIQMLQVLKKINLQKYFLSPLPDFNNLLSILNISLSSNIDDTFNYFNIFNTNSYKAEISTYVNRILNNNLYAEALDIVVIEGLLPDDILERKWMNLYTNNKDNEEFWLNCEKEFKLFNMSPMRAIECFNMCESENLIIQYQIAKLKYEWTFKNKLESLEIIERDMWNVYLKLHKSEVSLESFNESNLRLYTDMMLELDKIVMEAQKLDSEDCIRLECIINSMLDKGDIYRALRLEKFFVFSNEHLKILKLCYSLAEGLLLPCQLTAQERVLLRKNVNSRTFSRRKPFLATTRLSSSASRTSLPSSLGSVVEMETNIQDTLALLELLVENLKHGNEIGQNILMNFRISVNIDKSYRAILEATHPIEFLIAALNSNCNNKLEVVSDFTLVYNWTKQQITDFLCEQIINAINDSVARNTEFCKLWDINLDNDIHLILQLLSDSCTMLGTKLYSYASAMHKAQIIFNEKTDLGQIVEVIELLIRAHDCFTADCNMEGISVILKKCHTVFNLLLTLKNWKLIVRLLTGIGRYNELNYVFHMLRENDQFEFLLSKGKSNYKDNGLKVALLNYLKKYCPDNKELYKMVALYFTLYSEVAQLWETESESIIRNLIEISKLEMQNRKVNPDTTVFIEFTNTDGTRLCLKKAMENYTHAAEYHMQGEKLAKAMYAAQQAELIALQLSLLKGLTPNEIAICVLNLAPSQISTALLSSLNFQQALIVVESYNYQADWAFILYTNFALKNDRKYFESFITTFDITDTLVYDISRHFLSDNNNQESSISNMKYILQKLHSVHSKYRIASELGFNDIVEDLLIGDKLVFLKDTVWKKGYKC